MGRCREAFLTQVNPVLMGSDYLRTRQFLMKKISELTYNYFIPCTLPTALEARHDVYHEGEDLDWTRITAKRKDDIARFQFYYAQLKKVRGTLLTPQAQTAVDVLLPSYEHCLKEMIAAREREQYCSVSTIACGPTGCQKRSYEYVPQKGFMTEQAATADCKIYNTGRRWRLERDDCAIAVTQAQYNHLQELGATLRVDQALTSRLIGHIGKYRLNIEKKAFQFGVKTQHFSVKGTLCEFVTRRLRELQHVESSYGQGRAQVVVALKRYIKRLEALADGYLDEIQDSIYWRLKAIDKKDVHFIERSRLFNPHFKEIQKLKWTKKIIDEQLAAIEADLVEAKKFLKRVEEKSPLANGLDLSHKLQTLAAKERYGNDAMKYSVGEWVRERCHSIGRFAKRSNELITLSGAMTLGRGEFQSAYSDFDYECQQYEFAQNHDLTPAHQGWFDLDAYDKVEGQGPSASEFLRTAVPSDSFIQDDEEAPSDTQKRTVRLSDLASGRRSIRDTLFAFSLVLHDVDMNDDCDDAVEEVFSRGWRATRYSEARLVDDLNAAKKTGRDLNKRQQVMDCYFTLRESIGEAQEKKRHAFVKVIKGVGVKLKDISRSALEATIRTVVSIPARFKRDYTYTQSVAASPLALETLIQDHQSSLSKTRLEMDATFRKVAAARQAYTTQHPSAKVSVASDDYMKFMMQALSEDDAQTIPVFMAPYSFHAWNPRTPLSMVDDFGRDVGGIFVRGFEKSPLTWTISSLIFAVSGLAVTNPAAIAPALSKMGLSDASIKAFVTYNQCLAKALTANEQARFTTAGFTNMKLSFTILDALEFGGDSMAAKFLADLRYHAPAAMLVMLVAYCAGLGLREGSIPYISETLSAEAGDAAFVNDLFIGLKSIGFVFEGLHRNVDERSALANMISTGMNLVINLVRAPFALIINPFVGLYFLLSGQHDKASVAFKNAVRPMKDLLDTSIRIVVSVVDFSLRVLGFSGSFVKKVIKAPFEALINLLANVLPNVERERQVPNTEKIFESDENTITQRYTIGAESVLRFKSYVGKQVDKIARPMNNISRIVRNFYARLRTRDEMHFGDKPVTNITATVKAFERFLERNSLSQTQETDDVIYANHPAAYKPIYQPISRQTQPVRVDAQATLLMRG